MRNRDQHLLGVPIKPAIPAAIAYHQNILAGDGLKSCHNVIKETLVVEAVIPNIDLRSARLPHGWDARFQTAP